MIGSEAAQVLTEHPRTAGCDPQMMDSCGGLEINPVTRIAPPVSEFRFKIISNPHEPLVETADLEGNVAAYGKICSHELFDPSRPAACKVKFIVARKINSFLPRLDDATSHQVGIGLLMPIGVRLKKTWLRIDIVV